MDGTDSDGTVLESKKWRHLQEAKALAYSCWQMYEQQPSGLSPEYVEYTEYSNPRLSYNKRVSDLSCSEACGA